MLAPDTTVTFARGTPGSRATAELLVGAVWDPDLGQPGPGRGEADWPGRGPGGRGAGRTERAAAVRQRCARICAGDRWAARHAG